MRLLGLRLIRFGPFNGAELDFSERPLALHVVYGRNEAGKSTTLRAIRGLLYGIPDTRDAHLHRAPELRIAGRVALADGRELSLVRRKGRKQTLSSPDDQALDDGALAPFLDGVSPAQFEAMFGLDHETLREGGEALLAGGGELGTSLFDASSGGRAVRPLIERLRQEVDALYRPRSKAKTELGEALALYAQLATQLTQNQTQPDAWKAQAVGLEEARTRLQRLEARRQELLVEQDRLQRLVIAVPAVLAVRGLRGQREALGHVPDLPHDAEAQRDAADRALTEVRAIIARVTVESVRRREELASLPASEPLLRRGADVIDRLATSGIAQARADGDAQRLQRDLDTLNGEIAQALHGLGRSDDLESVRPLLGASPTRREALELALAHGQLHGAVVQARAALAAAQAEREAAGDLAPAGAPGARGTALAEALADVTAQGDLAALERTAERALVELEVELDAEVAALGTSLGREELALAPMPSAAAARAFCQGAAEAEAEGTSVAARRRAAAEHLAHAEQEIAALERSAALPSEKALVEARNERDRQWTELRRGWSAGPAPIAALGALERAVQQSDEVADRLRADWDRVARHARHQVERERALAELERAAADAEAVAGRAAALQADWRSACARVGLEPVAAVDAVSLAERLARWRARHAQRVLRGQEHERARALHALARERLAALTDGPAASLAALLERGRAQVAAAEEAGREDARRARRKRELEARVRAEQLRVEGAEQALAEWRGRWESGLVALGLGRDVSVTEVQHQLEQLANLGSLVARRDELKRRIDKIAANRRDLEREMTPAISEWAPELAALPVTVAAEELARLRASARERAARRQLLEGELGALRAELGEGEGRRAAAESHLQSLVERAGVRDASELVEALQRAGRARALDAELVAAEARYARAAEGLAPSEIESCTADDLATLNGRFSDVRSELTEIEEERQSARLELREREQGRDELARASPATVTADEMASLAARVRLLAERWTEKRIALGVLEREIERYRTDHQGPVVSAAGRLFARLTLGAYSGLSVEDGPKDTPVLAAVRARDARAVLTTELSDGARDQLYLALRLSTLEHFAGTREPLPFVLDDALVHFDDPRASAALAALAELGQKTQVLLFTHHEQIVRLATQLDPEIVRVHRLGDG